MLGTAASDEAQDGRRDDMVSFAKSRRAAWLAFLKSARLSAVGLDPSRHDSSTLREFQTSQHVEGEVMGTPASVGTADGKAPPCRSVESKESDGASVDATSDEAASMDVHDGTTFAASTCSASVAIPWSG